MMKIESSYHLHEAQLLADELTREQIPAFVKSDLRGAAGALPVCDSFCEVWIENDADQDRALEILSAHRKRSQAASGPEVECPECHEAGPANFAACWKCGHVRAQDAAPAASLAAGKRVIVAGRSLPVRLAWAATSLLPGALLFVQASLPLSAAATGMLALVLWWLSGTRRPDYCSGCQAPLTGWVPPQCEECSRQLAGDVTERVHAKSGGTVTASGMGQFLAVLVAIVLVALAGVTALMFGEREAGGTRRYAPAPTRPF